MSVAGRPDLTGQHAVEPAELSVEVDLADALEQHRDLVEQDVDPEQAVLGATGSSLEVDADEGDLAEQWADVARDDEDDADR